MALCAEKQPPVRRQKCVNKGLSFLKGEKKGEGAEEISEEGKQQSGAAVGEDEDQDSDSKEAITTVLSKVSNLSSFQTAYLDINQAR